MMRFHIGYVSVGAENLRRLFDRGVPIGCGNDGSILGRRGLLLLAVGGKSRKRWRSIALLGEAELVAVEEATGRGRWVALGVLVAVGSALSLTGPLLVRAIVDRTSDKSEEASFARVTENAGPWLDGANCDRTATFGDLDGDAPPQLQARQIRVVLLYDADSG